MITPHHYLFMSNHDIMTNSNYESMEFGIQVDREITIEELTNNETVLDALP